VGGSGILASALGENLARLGHEVHFISYERPFRLPPDSDHLRFHQVVINDYDLFKYPDYTLPLSVKMAEVSRDFRLDVLHVHYAVPHATAAILAREMLPSNERPRIVTTLHGTDTTLLGQDAGYGPAIRHALNHSQGVTTVSTFLKQETHRLLDFNGHIKVIYNFFESRPPQRSRESVRSELGLREDQLLILHSSNLRPLKRVDLLLETFARVRPADSVRLLVLAGGKFSPYTDLVRRLGLEKRVIVRENVNSIEDYLQSADLALITSDNESFCLSILEAMFFACPSVATNVGGIPEVIEDGKTGLLARAGDAEALARAVESLVRDPVQRATLGRAAQTRARAGFSADVIVPQYEALYRDVCG
jgi:N-acetyl-alpha-D-glucosaminyl L-malate synthase BshA